MEVEVVVDVEVVVVVDVEEVVVVVDVVVVVVEEERDQAVTAKMAEDMRKSQSCRLTFLPATALKLARVTGKK